MSAIRDHAILQKLLEKYAMKYGMKAYFNLLHGSIVDLSYYMWNKEEDKIMKDLYTHLYEAQKAWKS